ncbi:hypothetical protein PRZ48_000351 [Zasmidium cellare]|uniref:RNA polymerase II transcription factor B subunit 3 n=1 Tax=Zasmidium cellare TaxID=395010 RepID=A0ABR0EY81_ZASCE|nr:hypothetical protein PRZ48_000351 [Zasmidium cellare]
MSRLAQQKSSPVARRDGGAVRPPGDSLLTPQDGELPTRQMDRMSLSYSTHTDSPATEVCPVCKSTKYMNPNLKFLVNPVCYHKMCESCVDRLFSHGPAPCPIKGCSETLRKNRFRKQTFEDIKVEREVDIRKKVAQVFNRREEEFASLREYNDYLNDVEDITFNLINNIDIEETQRRFKNHEDKWKENIVENASLAQQEQMLYAEQQKAEREQAKRRREEARREEMEERKEAEATRRDMLRRLENGQDPEEVKKERAAVQLKKRQNRQDAANRQSQLKAADATNGSSSFVIKGLKNKKAKLEPEAPVDPFGGLTFEHSYFSLQDDYVWEGLREAKRDPLIAAGGYDIASFTGRALCEAFSGLGVMVADEAVERERLNEPETLSTTKAEIAAKDVKMEDPF